MFCFSEHRKYYPSDVIKEGLINQSLEKVFTKIWNQLSEIRRDEIKQLYGTPVDVLPDKWKDNQYELIKFRSGDMTYEEHLNLLISSLT